MVDFFYGFWSFFILQILGYVEFIHVFDFDCHLLLISLTLDLIEDCMILNDGSGLNGWVLFLLTKAVTGNCITALTTLGIKPSNFNLKICFQTAHKPMKNQLQQPPTQERKASTQERTVSTSDMKDAETTDSSSVPESMLSFPESEAVAIGSS